MRFFTLKMKLSGKESLLFDTETNHGSNFSLCFESKFCISFMIKDYSTPEISTIPEFFGTI